MGSAKTVVVQLVTSAHFTYIITEVMAIVAMQVRLERLNNNSPIYCSIMHRSVCCSILSFPVFIVSVRIFLAPSLSKSFRRRPRCLNPDKLHPSRSIPMRPLRLNLRRGRCGSTLVRKRATAPARGLHLISFFPFFLFKRNSIPSPRCCRRRRLWHCVFGSAPTQRSQGCHQEDRPVRSLDVLSTDVARAEAAQVSQRGWGQRERAFAFRRAAKAKGCAADDGLRRSSPSWTSSNPRH